MGTNKALFKIKFIKIPNSKPPSISNRIYTSNLIMKDIQEHVNPPIIIVRISSIEKALPIDDSLLAMNQLTMKTFEIDDSVIEAVAGEAIAKITQIHSTPNNTI